MEKTKSELLEYYSFHGISSLNDGELKRLFNYVFRTKPHPYSIISYKYLIHSLRHPEIYKTRFNK